MKCPGQDSRYWKPGAIFDVKCPNCGYMIEFFKDDTRRRCPNCDQEVPNPEMDFGCAAYCPYAEHCLGSLPDGVVADGKLKVLKAKMLKALKAGAISAGVNVALAARFMELVEEIGKKESAPLGPTLLAAYGFCVAGLDEGRLKGEEFARVRQGLSRKIQEVGAEIDAVEEALSLLECLSDECKEFHVPREVILDAFKIASGQQGKGPGPSEGELFTEAAKQIIRVQAADGGGGS